MNIFEQVKVFFRDRLGGSFHPKNPSYWAQKLWGGQDSEAGTRVDEETAMKFTAYNAAVKILAEDIASLPLNTYKRLKPKGKEKDIDHHLFYLLHNQPNEDMTSIIWRELMVAHILGWGNHYSVLRRDRANKVAEIYPLLPWRMKAEKVKVGNKKVKLYRYQPTEGSEVVLDRNDVLHIPGLSYDGIEGLSPLGWYREQIGLGLAMQTYSSKFFANGMNAGGVFTTPQVLKEETYDRLKKDLEKKYKGLGKAHSSMILEQELKFDKISINPNDAQLLESKKFQVEEIARMFRLPLHLLQSLDRATNNNIEHQSIDYVVHTLRPWLVRIEQAYIMQLLPESEKRTHFIEHVVDGLLRGDIASRYDAYAKGRQNGWLSADDIREMENMNPLPDGQGKVYFAPLNMVPLDQLSTLDQRSLEKRKKLVEEINSLAKGQKPEEAKAEKPKAIVNARMRSAQGRKRLAGSYSPLISNVATRIIKRETEDIIKEAKSVFDSRTNTTGFYQFLDSYYEKHKEFIEKHSKPVFYDFGKAIAEEAAAEVGYKLGSNDNIERFLESFSKAFTLRHARENKDRIIKVVEKGLEEGIEPVDMLEVEFGNWKADKPGQIANKQSIKESGAVSKVIYGSAGVRKLVWVNTGSESCPFCQSLNGKVVGISEPFFLKGQDFQPDGADSKLSFGWDITHPPLHDGCQCMISPA